MKSKSSRLITAAPWALGSVAGLFVLGNLATSVYIQQTMVRPRRKPSITSDLSNFTPSARYTTSEVRFRCEDGYCISALLLKPERTNGHAILICHGLAHDKRSGVRFVQYLLREGYTLFCLDFRNHGDSEGTITTYGFYEKKDIFASVRFLREELNIRGNVGIMGASMGASIALMAAAECDEVSALVLDSPFASLSEVTMETTTQVTGLPRFLMELPVQLAFLWARLFADFAVPDVHPAEKARNIRIPTFLIHGLADDRIPAHHSQEIYQNLQGGENELWLVEDAGHLGAYLLHPGEYERRVLSFFNRHLIQRPAAQQQTRTALPTSTVVAQQGRLE